MTEFYITDEQLKEMRALPLNDKIQLSVAKILQTINITNGNIYVAYSGGKDSGIILDLVAHTWSITKHKDEPLYVGFANTGMEYKGMIDFVKSFVKATGEKYGIEVKLVITQPKKTFKQVLEEEGYPIGSKLTLEYVSRVKRWLERCGVARRDVMAHIEPSPENYEWFIKAGVPKTGAIALTRIFKGKDGEWKPSIKFNISRRWVPLIWAPFKVSNKCCDFLKKEPQRELEKLGRSIVTGLMAVESQIREHQYMAHGCVSVMGGRVYAQPMGFWTLQDVCEYYYKFPELPLFYAYGKAVKNEDGSYGLDGKLSRTGCKLCLFGCAFKDNGIHSIKELEPHTCEVALRPLNEGGFGYEEVIDYLNTYCGCDIDMGQYGNQLTLFNCEGHF